MKVLIKILIFFLEMEGEFSSNEKILLDLTDQIKQMTLQMQRYLSDIIDVSEFHRTCQPL